MPRKKSNRKDQLSPIERLISGKVGPLPLDNDQHSPEVKPEHIYAGTRSLDQDANSEHFDPLRAAIFRDYTDLTEEEYQAMLNEA